MNSKETIDILVATYNGEKFIKQQIDSIINQTYNNIRIIISDDCSTDSTRQILEEYKKKDDRIILYFQEKNIGYIKNFEFLLTKVESKFYALSDQDDVWLPEKLEYSLDKLISTDSDLIHSDLIVVDTNLDMLYKSRWKKMGLTKKVKYDDTRSLYLYNCITGCTILAKSKFIKDILPLPCESKFMVHDYWISLYYSIKGKICHIDKPLILYRQHGNNQIGTQRKSTSLETFKEVRDLFIKVKIEHFTDFINRSDIFNDEQRKLNNKALQYFKKLYEVKYFNFYNLNIFHRLYKYETFLYYIGQFFILNFPLLSNISFKIFKFVQNLIIKGKGKRNE